MFQNDQLRNVNVKLLNGGLCFALSIVYAANIQSERGRLWSAFQRLLVFIFPGLLGLI